MNVAEGKGPKQVKRTWATGQFVTIYGNDGAPTGVPNPAPVPYPPAYNSAGSVGYMTTSGAYAYAIPGSVNPGLNVASGTNGGFDVSPVLAPGNESLQDLQSTVVALSTEVGFSGTSKVWLQGTLDRFTPNPYYTSITGSFSSTNWVNIGSATISGYGNGPVLISLASSSGYAYNAYRLVASGGTGIIDWSVPGMFIDFSAQQIGQEAIWVNGNFGNTNIQDNDIITISGGAVTAYTENPLPLSNGKPNENYIG